MLEKEFKYYLDHQEELVKKFNERFIVIKDEKILGDYAEELEALEKTLLKHKAGTFLIQYCAPGAESYSQEFFSLTIVV